MAITEKDRHELYRRLEEILGPDEATTLMEHLPPVGWADVTTKDDLAHLDIRVSGQIRELDMRLTGQIRELDMRLTGQISELGQRMEVAMANLSASLHTTLRTNTYVTIGAMTALVSAVTAITTLG